ncbi:MAG: DUF4252 domain-containing protein [Bacteroidales bacterium]|nr:DUF4252 domain-containing protein [Bacteroidales bacterium]MCF8387128.1 DUF4252 domain-containing protein [Bacteroidales bacterium]MCF8398877.1 DUF4252 domain-containing protein [Bacteroidales bacterium]
MKRIGIILSLLVFALAMTSNAQSGKLGKLFDDYKDSKGYKLVDINADININDEDGKEFLENIDNIKVISLEVDGDIEKKDIRKFHEEAMKAIKKDGFEEMINVMDGDEKVNFYVSKAENGKAKECVLSVKEGDEAVLVYISGIIDFSKAMSTLGNLHLDMHDNCEDEK